MEIQPNTVTKPSLKANKGAPKPTKCSVGSRSPPATSTSKVLIITPEQIAKLGLTQQINKAMQSQVATKLPPTTTKSETLEPSRRKNVRISKITIINPKSSLDGNKEKEPEVLKNTEMGKSDSTAVKAHISANIMKNKLQNLLKSRPPLQIPSTSCNKILKDNHEPKLEVSGRKRKFDDDEDDDDDVILVDNPSQEEELNKEIEKSHQTVSVIVKNDNIEAQSDLNANEDKDVVEIKTSSNNIRMRQSKLKPVPNILSKRNVYAKRTEIYNQEQHINDDVVEEISPPICEDVKQKIHVLSNEQISLPHTYIASLKSHLTPDRHSKSHSSPFLIYKSHNIDAKPINDDIKQENVEDTKIDVKTEDLQKSTKEEINQQASVNVGDVSEELKPDVGTSNEQQSIINPENLDTRVIDEDSMVIINTSSTIEVVSESQNKVQSSNHVENQLNNETDLPVIDLTDAIEEEEEIQKNIINNYEKKIKKHIKTNTNPVIVDKFEKPIEFKITGVKKTYSKKSNLLLAQEHAREIADEESKNAEIPETCSIIEDLIEVALNAKSPIKRDYNRKRNSSATGNESSAIENEPSIIRDNIKTDNAEVTQKELNQEAKPTPKKRGRKKKSETIPPEIIKPPANIPEPELETSRRGRKRKVVDYFALSGGSEFDEPESTNPTKKPRRNPSTFVEDLDNNTGIVEIDTTISCNSNDNSINCTYTSQEITPKETPKRKRGRPPKIKVTEEQINDTTDVRVVLFNDKSPGSANKISEGTLENINEENTSEKQNKDGEKTSENNKGENEKINEEEKTNFLSKNEEIIEDSEKNKQTSAIDIEETNASPSKNAEESKDKEKTNDAKQTNEITTNETSEQNEKTPKKKRGRPRRIGPSSSKQLLDTMFQQINTPSALDLDKTETSDENNTKNEDTTENNPEIETVVVKDESDGSDLEEQPKKNGRTKKKGGKKKEQPESNTSEPSATSSDGPIVTCAVCSKEIAKTAWGNHKLRFHNNLAWKIGEPPLDLNDQKLVMRVLTEIYKRHKPLYCEKCGESKKSVIGYLSHKTKCQKSTEELSAMRVKCEYCDKAVLPVSLSTHLKFCRANTNNSNFEENNSLSSFDDSPVQGKRRAAQKAQGLIRSLKEDDAIEITDHKKHGARWYVNFDFKPTYFVTKCFRTEILKNGVAKCRFEGCAFESSNVEEISNHLYTCEEKLTMGFTCKFCIKTFDTHSEVIQHLRDAHTSGKGDETSIYEDRSDGEELEEEYYDDYDEDVKIIDKTKVAVNNRANLLHGIKFLLKHRYCVPSTHIAYPPAFDWTLKFCKQNFSITNLFPNWRTTSENWEKLQPALLANYLPHLKYSACTSVVENNKFVDPLKLNHEWKRYKLFEATSFNKGSSTIFCGGPIYAMAWAPTPFDKKNCNQILAISANIYADKEYTFDIKYSEPGLIQFWNCGPLANEVDAIESPKLEFCIAHNYGPIWYLEWCPSGCCDFVQDPEHNSLQRLGILAIGSGNSNIYLYSVCSPGQISINVPYFKLALYTMKPDLHYFLKSNNPCSGKILKPKPIMKLILDSVVEHAANDLEAHVTKISWSKASGHEYLVAGYANGMVAAYYLNTTSSLLKLGLDHEEIETIMPYRVFSAHHHAITVLSLYHLNDGRRWILTGSIDRTIKYWDLENPIVPLTNFTKYIVTDGIWLSHWLSSLHCFDDSCAGGLTYTLAHQVRNFESESTSVMHSNSRVVSITGSEWINGFVQGNVVGELQGFFPHQMFFSMDGHKSFKNKKVMLGYTRLVEKDLSIPERLKEEKLKLERVSNKSKQTDPEDIKPIPDFSRFEPTTYREAEQKYGLVFCDMRLNTGKEFNDSISSYHASNKLQKFYATRPNIYPLQSITKVAFNPNQSSHLYLATGYQAGFVKISYMQFFNKRRK